MTDHNIHRRDEGQGSPRASRKHAVKKRRGPLAWRDGRAEAFDFRLLFRPDLYERLAAAGRNVSRWRRLKRAAEGLLIGAATRLRAPD